MYIRAHIAELRRHNVAPRKPASERRYPGRTPRVASAVAPRILFSLAWLIIMYGRTACTRSQPRECKTREEEPRRGERASYTRAENNAQDGKKKNNAVRMYRGKVTASRRSNSENKKNLLKLRNRDSRQNLMVPAETCQQIGQGNSHGRKKP